MDNLFGSCCNHPRSSALESLRKPSPGQQNKSVGVAGQVSPTAHLSPTFKGATPAFRTAGETPPAEDIPKLVSVLETWNKDQFISDPTTAAHCIDLYAGELVVVIRKGSHGWYYGRVVHEKKISGDPADSQVQPTESGREGWFPPSFSQTVPSSLNHSEIGRQLLQGLRTP
jgi:hypothetical protein